MSHLLCKITGYYLKNAVLKSYGESFVVVPLVAGWFTRLSLRSARRIERLETRLKPLAIGALIATVLLLLMVQAQAILANPLAIVLIAIPLILQASLIFWITAFWMRSAGQPRSIAAPGAMIGASNFLSWRLR